MNTTNLANPSDKARLRTDPGSLAPATILQPPHPPGLKATSTLARALLLAIRQALQAIPPAPTKAILAPTSNNPAILVQVNNLPPDILDQANRHLVDTQDKARLQVVILDKDQVDQADQAVDIPAKAPAHQVDTPAKAPSHQVAIPAKERAHKALVGLLVVFQALQASQDQVKTTLDNQDQHQEHQTLVPADSLVAPMFPALPVVLDSALAVKEAQAGLLVLAVLVSKDQESAMMILALMKVATIPLFPENLT